MKAFLEGGCAGMAVVSVVVVGAVIWAIVHFMHAAGHLIHH